MKTALGFFALAILTSPLQIVWGQEEQAKEEVVKAIKKLETGNVALLGSVNEEQPTGDVGGPLGGGVQRIVVSSVGGSSSSPFTGDFEALAGKQGLAILSKEEFPGIKIFQSGEKRICIQSHDEEPFDVNSLTGTMKHLVNWTALSQAIEGAKKVRVTQKGDETTVRINLDGSYIPVETMEKKIAQKMAGAGGVVGNVAIQVGGPSGMTPQVVDLVANVVLGPTKDVKSMEFVVQYSDPMKAMMANAMKAGGAIRIGGAPKPKQADEDLDLGKLVTYSFSTAKEPSERMTQFVGQAKKLLDAKK